MPEDLRGPPQHYNSRIPNTKWQKTLVHILVSHSIFQWASPHFSEPVHISVCQSIFQCSRVTETPPSKYRVPNAEWLQTRVPWGSALLASVLVFLDAISVFWASYLSCLSSAFPHPHFSLLTQVKCHQYAIVVCESKQTWTPYPASQIGPHNFGRQRTTVPT